MNTIRELLKKPVAYQPIVAKAFGSAKLAIIWSQIYYWQDKTNHPDGWIYKTREDIFEETGLDRREQETARRIGNELGVLESKRMGHPCTVHFRINMEKTEEVLHQWTEKNIKSKNTGLRIESVKATAEPKIEKQRNEAISIFKLWNDQKIVMHGKMTDKISLKIKSALKEYSEKEIKEAIEKYGRIINSHGYFWTYRWTLQDFLQRGLTRFLDTPIENFKIKEYPKKKKIKRVYQGMEMVESRGKTWCIPPDGGEWLEFAGDKKDIIEKEV